MKNLPSFRDEEFITSDKDFMINLNFQLCKIHFPLPAGYKPEYLPESYTNDGPFMKIDYGIRVSDDKIEGSGDYSFKKNLYEAHHYPALKGTFEKVVSLFNEMIVLVKK